MGSATGAARQHPGSGPRCGGRTQAATQASMPRRALGSMRSSSSGGGGGGETSDTLTHLEEPLSLGGRQASDCTQRGDGFWVHRGRQAAVAGAHGSL